MTQRFVVAREGFDADTARVWETVVNDLYPNPKIDTTANPAHAGIIFLDWRNTTGILGGITRILDSFPHNYGYTPSVFASYGFDNGTLRSGGTLPLQIGALGVIFIDADETNINLKYYSTDTAGPATPIPAFLLQARYYVMAERGL